MQEVAIGNYRSFIAIAFADALLAIRHQVSFIHNHLQSMLLILFLNIQVHVVIIFNLIHKQMPVALEKCFYTWFLIDKT